MPKSRQSSKNKLIRFNRNVVPIKTVLFFPTHPSLNIVIPVSEPGSQHKAERSLFNLLAHKPLPTAPRNITKKMLPDIFISLFFTYLSCNTNYVN